MNDRIIEAITMLLALKGSDYEVFQAMAIREEEHTMFHVFVELTEAGRRGHIATGVSNEAICFTPFNLCDMLRRRAEDGVRMLIKTAS